jgi:hypothetical protein
MNEQQLYRRLVRRSRHRSRSLVVIVALVVFAIATAYAGVELVLAALGLTPLLLGPADAIKAVEHPDAVALVAAAVALVLGIVLLIAALGSGRRARHELPDERMAVVLDDQVLAGAISKVTRSEARVSNDRVSTSVSRRRAIVRAIPTSGQPLDAAALATSAESVVASLDPKPSLRVALTVAEHGVVGS